jgi:membrane protein DedA with SNARE-associated domain
MAALQRAGGARLPPPAAAGSRRSAAASSTGLPPTPAPLASPARRAPAAAVASRPMTALIERFGALGVFFLMVPESACVPVPSEVTLLFSGFAVHRRWMSFPLAVLAATAGNLVGSLLAYGLGASGILERVPAARALLRRSEDLLERHGTRTVFLARLLPLARTFISLPAGARRIPLVPFIALTTLGCALWATAFVLTGVLAGTAWTTVNSVLGRALLGLAALAIVASVIRRRRTRE